MVDAKSLSPGKTAVTPMDTRLHFKQSAKTNVELNIETQRTWTLALIFTVRNRRMDNFPLVKPKSRQTRQGHGGS